MDRFAVFIKEIDTQYFGTFHCSVIKK